MLKVELYDTTLRDGAQSEGISLSVDDKIMITQKLDQLGIHYVEGGWPGSNPKDAEFFSRAKQLKLSNSTLAAFGSTRRAGTLVEQDPNLKALLDAGTSVVTLVGKSWDLHVTSVLETTLEENLSMITDSVAYFNGQGRRVFFDAEHFFDGYRSNPDYAKQTILAAAKSGAECVVLCDTNGGTLPHEIGKIVSEVRDEVRVKIGIHTHNDSDTAVASALAAVAEGASHIQGTINGYGERCGNANLLSVIGNLKLKMGINCISDVQLADLTDTSRFVAEVANMPPQTSQPFVGASAFAHKGGLHASAMAKNEHSYQHISPSAVGNSKRVLVSELSGKSNILYKVEELGLNVSLAPSQAKSLLEVIKQKESEGLQYEGAEASFEVLVRRFQPGYQPPFSLVDLTVIVEKRGSRTIEDDQLSSKVMLKVNVGDEQMHTAAEGNGPVNALDHGLRKALIQYYPSLERVRLLDYKVRVIDRGHGTESLVRVLIDSTDGNDIWSTVGCSHNIIEASWMALSDSLEYWLLKH